MRIQLFAILAIGVLTASAHAGQLRLAGKRKDAPDHIRRAGAVHFGSQTNAPSWGVDVGPSDKSHRAFWTVPNRGGVEGEINFQTGDVTFYSIREMVLRRQALEPFTDKLRDRQDRLNRRQKKVKMMPPGKLPSLATE
jgi:hypothetical protein